MWLVLSMLACNTAPVDYRATDPSPLGQYAWDHPTDGACEARGAAVEVEGFLFCGADNEIRPVDDPILVECGGDAGVPGEVDVFWAFDGLIARAYPLPHMRGRELVHEDWPLGPVLVDW